MNYYVTCIIRITCGRNLIYCKESFEKQEAGNRNTNISIEAGIRSEINANTRIAYQGR